ncbi:MAG: hypothetical protein U1A24_02690 [Cypionkella sp.]|uniref:hypothetical protein n=1 Tax=Cypionkella sp. TaxID=2811411 RepID=UPI002AB9AF49|nr:hypothetical protein [Cypionkella sp.]MDZ4309455.1 hypothetical protein [Cypionkella sp.]
MIRNCLIVAAIATMPPVAIATMPTAALAENFTTAAEIKPILDATRANWIAVREYDGKDLLYFTHLLAWRCGLSEIRYGLNGAAPDKIWPMEPCYDTEPQPNALKMEGAEIYLTEPLGSIQTINVSVTYDDGSEASADFNRAAVMTP